MELIIFAGDQKRRRGREIKEKGQEGRSRGRGSGQSRGKGQEGRSRGRGRKENLGGGAGGNLGEGQEGRSRGKGGGAGGKIKRGTTSKPSCANLCLASVLMQCMHGGVSPNRQLLLY
jgi:hypothetical protein